MKSVFEVLRRMDKKILSFVEKLSHAYQDKTGKNNFHQSINVVGIMIVLYIYTLYNNETLGTDIIPIGCAILILGAEMISRKLIPHQGTNRLANDPMQIGVRMLNVVTHSTSLASLIFSHISLGNYLIKLLFIVFIYLLSVTPRPPQRRKKNLIAKLAEKLETLVIPPPTPTPQGIKQ